MALVLLEITYFVYSKDCSGGLVMVSTRLVAVLLVLACLVTLTTITLDINLDFGHHYPSNGPCPSNNSVNWVITSGRLNLVQRTALESIFLHNPDACLNIYMKEDMEDTVEVLFHVKRLQNDGFLIFVLPYNFRALLTRTLSQIKAIPSQIVEQFFQQLPSHEKGE